MEIAELLASKGAKCTPGEIKWLGQKFTKFQQWLQEKEESEKEEKIESVQVSGFSPSFQSTCQEIEQQKSLIHQFHWEKIELEEKLKKSEKERKKQEEKLKKSEGIKKTLLLTRQLKFISLKDLKIIKILGQGNNGIVFLVEIQLAEENLQLALKMILNFHRIKTGELNLFWNEFDVLFKLVDIHPNIIHILSDFTAPPTQEMIQNVDDSVRPLLMKQDALGEEVPITTQFFLIEYHPVTLKDHLKNRKRSVEEIYKFAEELLDCFSFLFDNKVVHRDAKMDNILVSVDGSLILSDFGESLELDKNYCRSRLTLRAGNLRFTAPEVHNELKRGSDEINFSKQHSWDVGCLLFQIIFGKFPFPKYPMNPTEYGKTPNLFVPGVVFPESEVAIDIELLKIINKLLKSDPALRISIKDARSQFLNFLRK